MMIVDREQKKFKIEDYERIFNEMQDCYMTADPAGTILFVNPAAVRVLGYESADELIGGDIAATVYAYPEKRKNFKSILLEQGHVKDYEVEFKRKNGEHFIAECNVRILFDERGQPIAFEGLFRDISLRKQAEDRLLAHTRFLENLDLVDCAILAANDLDRMLQDVMNAVHEIFGADRTWLLYPCDPGAPSWRVPVECTRPEYPGAFELNAEVPMTEDAAMSMRENLATNSPLSGVIRPGEARWDPDDRYGVRSYMTTAVHPKVGKPWQLGLHQCSHARIWTDWEKRLFRAISRRVGDALGTQLILRDLCKNRERSDLAQEVANIGIWDWDLAGGELYWSGQIGPMLGFLPGEFGGEYESFLDRVHPEDRSAVMELVRSCMDGEREYHIEHRVAKPDRTETWVAETGKVFTDAGGKSVRMLGIVQDITERKKAEDRHRAHIYFLESLERIEKAIHKADDVEQMLRPFIRTVFSIFDCDRAWLLYPCDPDAASFRVPVECNRPGYPGAFELGLEIPVTPSMAKDFRDALASDNPIISTLGTERSVEKDTAEQFGVRAEMFKALFPRVGRAWMVGVHQCSYARIWTPGEQKLFNEIGCRLADHLSTMLSLENLRKSEEELKQHRGRLEELVEERTTELKTAKERAEAANRAKTVFLSNMSHELRTPLNVILGYSRLMQRNSSLLPEERHCMTVINRSGEHLLELIDEVLEISRIEAGQSELNVVSFNLRALLHSLENIFAPDLEAKDLRFAVTGIEDVPLFAEADENKLRRVLINILGNAVKFTEKGGITMRVSVGDGGMRLKVEVEDTGPGIAENELDRVFEYFEQTASGRNSKSGSGLGLAISRDYARMMGGDITVAGSEGNGCIFRFDIRIGEGGDSDAGQSLKRRVIGLQPGSGTPRILVAEDMEESRIMLVKILKAAGFLVREASNGLQAVEQFETWRPDFIWMDVRMPVMDGLEAVCRIKAAESGKSTVVAALTAHALEEEKEKIMAAGCDDFVRKPFREHEIFEVMGRHLDLNYIYEPNSAEEDDFKSGVELTPEQLSDLPAGIRNRFHDAVLKLDTARSLALIEEIKEHDAYVGGLLGLLAGNLDYGRILKLLENETGK